MPYNTRRYFQELGESADYPQTRGLSPSDPEFPALVRSKIGDQYQHLVNPETQGLAALVGDPSKLYNLRGINLSPDASLDTRMYQRDLLKDQLQGAPGAPSLLDTVANTSSKRIIGVGRGVNPKVWAHEFRHAEVKDEAKNRLEDLVNATSYPDYKHSITSMYDILTNGKGSTKVPFENKESHVLSDAGVKFGLISRLQKHKGRDVSYEDAASFLNNNIELNKAGAKGAYSISGDQLDKDVIRARAKIPLLNFIGVGQSYSHGGSIENTTHDRKLI